MNVDNMFKQERGRTDPASKEVPIGCVPVRHNFCQKVSKEKVSLTDKTHSLQNAEEAYTVYGWEDVATQD
jgi:hypothetical protein